MMNVIKMSLAFLLVVAGIAGFYYLQGSSIAFSEVLRFVVILMGFVLSAGVMLTTESGKRFFGFAKESVLEAKRVVWPTWKETYQTTGVVVLFAVVMALFIWGVDSALLFTLNKLMGRG